MTSFLWFRLWLPIPTALLLGRATGLGLAKGNVSHKIGIRLGVGVQVGVGTVVEVGAGVRISGMLVVTDAMSGVGRESSFG